MKNIIWKLRDKIQFTIKATENKHLFENSNTNKKMIRINKLI